MENTTFLLSLASEKGDGDEHVPTLGLWLADFLVRHDNMTFYLKFSITPLLLGLES
jgi:hypothetical protein